MKQTEQVVYKSKEATFLARLVGIFKDEIKNPMFSVLASSLSSLIKAVDASESLQKTFARVFNYVKEYWNEN